MDLEEEIQREHSKRQALKIAGWVGKEKKRFRMLLDVFMGEDEVPAQRSAYPLSMILEKHPELAKENLHLLLNRLSDVGIHDAVKRCVFRTLQYVKIPKRHQARVFNICMGCLSSPKETVAVRCFSMTVLGNLAGIYPELKNEVIETIRVSLKNPTAGIKARANRELKRLQG